METMNPLKQFELRQEFACFRLIGEHSFKDAVERVKEAIQYSREQRIRKLLVDSLDVRGFASPSIVERFWMAEEIAEAVGGGALKIALVARPELIDPQKFGIVVAQNRGLDVDVFHTEEAATQWLLAP